MKEFSQILTLEKIYNFKKINEIHWKFTHDEWERERERKSIGIPLNANLVSPLGSQLIISIITYIRDVEVGY